MRLACMYRHGKASRDKILGPAFAPNKGKRSEILASSRDAAGSNGLGVPRGEIKGCIKRRPEFGSFLVPYGEASALERLLLELQFRGRCCNPVLYLRFVSSTGDQGRGKCHGSGLTTPGRSPVCAPEGKGPSPGEANGTSRCFCSSWAQILTTKQNLYVYMRSIGTKEEAKVVHNKFTSPPSRVRN